MLHTIPRIRLRASAGICIAIGVALLAGCAQQQRPVGFYDTPHDSTLADAQQQAQGQRGARAPSQVQIGFGETEEERHARLAAEAARASEEIDARAASGVASTRNIRPLLEAKTFLGTVPCASSDTSCPAVRMTLTLAPSGEWRARAVPVNATSPDNAILQQGCWDVMGTEPLRIILQDQGDEGTISLTFVNDNVLRLGAYNDIQPMLDYHLTRQADIDPIDELVDQPALACG